MRWFWVSLSFATFGLAVDDKGKVAQAAPIARWALGKDAVKVLGYYIGREAIIREF
jgi:hypothetical protein